MTFLDDLCVVVQVSDRIPLDDLRALLKYMSSYPQDDTGDDVKLNRIVNRLDLKADIEQPHKIEFVLYDADNVRRDMKTGEPAEYQPETKIMMPDNHREQDL